MFKHLIQQRFLSNVRVLVDAFSEYCENDCGIPLPTLCGRQARQASVKYKVAPGDGHLSHLSSPRDLATSASHPHNSAQHHPAQPSTYDKHNTIDAGL